MEQRFTYPARLSADDDGVWLVEFADIPEALTDGATIAEAIEMAEDCLAEALAGRINRGEEIPRPSAITAATVGIACPPQIALKAAIYELMRQQQVTKVALAQRMGVNEKEARRIVDPHHGTRIAALVQALKVLGKRVTISVDDAPQAA